MHPSIDHLLDLITLYFTITQMPLLKNPGVILFSDYGVSVSVHYRHNVFGLYIYTLTHMYIFISTHMFINLCI